MAINIPILTEFQDNGVKAAKAAFQNFKTAVADAEGGMGKFKAGSKVALDAVAANAEIFAVAGAAALGKFVASGITAFSDLAISAGKFSDATGLYVEDASRYIEAAGDLGIPIDAVEGAIGRLNKTIGADSDKVRDLGVDLVYLKDGSLDVNETFKNTIDRIKGIKDPAEKARVAAQLLGKGWQSMAELIESGSVKFEESLNSVSEQKVISPEELQMAKDYRDAMNNLGDATEDVKIKAGKNAIPLVTFLANGLNAALDLDAKLTELGKDIFGNGTQDPNTELIDFANNVRDARDDLDLLKESIKQVKNPLGELKTSADNASVAIVSADTAWKNLTGTLDREVALDNAEQDLKDLQTAAANAFGTTNQALIDAYDEKAAKFAGSLSAIATSLDGLSSKEIYIRLNLQGEAAALELARYYARGAEYGGISEYDALTLAGISGTRASGGPVAGGSTYLVGERGPELFTPGTSGTITPNGALGGINIVVNAGMGTNGTAVGEAIVQEINKYARSGGTKLDRRVI